MHLTTYIGKHSLLSLYSFYLTLATPLTLVTMDRGDPHNGRPSIPLIIFATVQYRSAS